MWKFHKVIKRAMIACETSNNKVSDHFPEFRKKVDKTTKHDIISVEKSKRYYMEKLTIKGFQDKSNIEIIEELMKKIMDILLLKNLICLTYTECIFQSCKKKVL